MCGQANKTAWSSKIEQQLCFEMKTFLLAGHETSAAMLTWTLLELCRNPELTQQVHTCPVLPPPPFPSAGTWSSFSGCTSAPAPPTPLSPLTTPSCHPAQPGGMQPVPCRTISSLLLMVATAAHMHTACTRKATATCIWAYMADGSVLSTSCESCLCCLLL